MDAESQIASAVDSWLETAAKPNATPDYLTALWEQVLLLLWRRASLTLGEVTLAVIFDRVLLEVASRHPLAKHIRFGESAPDLLALRAAGTTAEAAALRAGVRDFIISYISLLDALTAGILTPVLLKELEKAVR